MTFKDKKELEILRDLKKLSNQLEHINSFSGLLMYQSDIQRFYEDFIFLKKLNNIEEGKFYIPPSGKLQSTNSAVKEKLLHQQQVEEDKIQKEEKEEEPINIHQMEAFNNSPKEENRQTEKEPIEEMFDTTVEETFSPSKTSEEPQKSKSKKILDDSINFNFSIQAGKKYQPLNIDLNDEIAFLNYLFEGERDDYETFIENLNHRNPITSESYINHYIENRGWGQQHEEYIHRLSQLNKKRFE